MKSWRDKEAGADERRQSCLPRTHPDGTGVRYARAIVPFTPAGKNPPDAVPPA